MKIINHGNTYKSDKDLEFERFKCEKCKCEFNALEDEYYRDYAGAETSNGGLWTSVTISVTKTVKDYLVCSCPECHKIIKKVKERYNINCSYTEITPTGTYVPYTSGTSAASKEVLDTEVSS